MRDRDRLRIAHRNAECRLLLAGLSPEEHENGSAETFGDSAVMKENLVAMDMELRSGRILSARMMKPDWEVWEGAEK
jgi:hypothetical protein